MRDILEEFNSKICSAEGTYLAPLASTASFSFSSSSAVHLLLHDFLFCSKAPLCPDATRGPADKGPVSEGDAPVTAATAATAAAAAIASTDGVAVSIAGAAGVATTEETAAVETTEVGSGAVTRLDACVPFSPTLMAVDTVFSAWTGSPPAFGAAMGLIDGDFIKDPAMTLAVVECAGADIAGTGAATCSTHQKKCITVCVHYEDK